MKKINLVWIVVVGMIILVSAAVSISLSNVSYSTPVEPEALSEDTFIFDCDGNSTTIKGEEQDNKWDEGDILKVLRKKCSGVITNIQKDGLYWKENEYGLKSFDEDELWADACKYSKDGFTDYKDGKCVEPPPVIEEEELG